MATHRRSPQPGFTRTSRVTVLSAAAAAAALSGGAAVQVAAADPAGTATDTSSRVDRLYQQAEQATEQYNAAQERASRLRHEVDSLQDQAARGQERVNRMRDDLGAIAGAQYRSGGVDPAMALMLSSDPNSYLDRAEALERITSHQASRLAELQEAQRSLEQKRSMAAAKLADLEHARATMQDRKRNVQGKLGAAQRLLDALPPAQRAGFVPGMDDRASRSGRAAPDMPDLPASSSRAAMAVAAARRAIGSPYVWGSTGPGSFDCSGLMQYSYRQAGVSLPRTSQEQKHAGQRVPLDQARPGDLVIYRDNASHVGMYVGGGRVVHAPYPGARVRYDPVDMMPVSAVTRP
ncbi:NlpC/P60 family protein [Streptomyces sp. H10-C2]|uniref:C40 family peptidase n=1 Tax=unclassified Streptomyces TaxID=2593676 RepID=UPI0024B8919B|nr:MULTISPECIES: NlpC/P60 family protein [unclassified Streptomyces]MDJ0341138.1 NlpC/P60 family protein [Streptomyces sp. PH10-H1]MDJ0369510.1 NlpC/P60 family protein [Streptomyces sp. H10-C2]